MMKKAIKKLLAALLAVAMVCAMAVPAFAYHTKEDINKDHAFSAFQIFTGDVKGNNIDDFKISNVKWGSSITKPTEFLAQLTADSTIGSKFNNPTTAQDVLAVISQWNNSDDNSIAFARVVCHYLYPNANANPPTDITGDNTLTFNQAGYYLIVDTTKYNPGDSYVAYNSFMLTVTQANWKVDVTPKVEKPTVEKEVHDNDNNDISSAGNNDGWGSSADHAINEKFQFRLIAKLPASDAHVYDYYDKYTVSFKDTLSKGITFDRLDTVEITSGSTTQEIPAEKYSLDKRSLPSSFTLGIEDVKTCVEDSGFNLNNGATITVTYTAHLNDEAAVNTTNDPTNNKNSVRLQYSNNPRPSEYWGYTPEITPENEVYVYTYQLNNTKRAESANGAPLPDVGFCLYSDEACTQEVKLYKKDDFYFPIKDATDKEAVKEMYSDKDGKFNIKGLDAGTYYLKETTPPTGYSACDVPPVTIKATHNKERVYLDGSTLSTTIINNKSGITLPSTGGIGTTIFYVVGGGLMVAAIVLLVTKKRMENK